MKASGFESTHGKVFTSSAPSRDTHKSRIRRTPGFIGLALAGESGLALLAFGLGRTFGLSPLQQLHISWRSLLWGLFATLPPLLTLRWTLTRRRGGLRNLVHYVVTHLGPLLADCSVLELASLAAAAGFAEELLFRGVVQAGLADRLPTIGALIAASVLFGLVHFVTTSYAVFSGFMGLYLGALFLMQGSLLSPMLTHALYDFVALTVVVQRYEASLITSGLE